MITLADLTRSQRAAMRILSDHRDTSTPTSVSNGDHHIGGITAAALERRGLIEYVFVDGWRASCRLTDLGLRVMDT